MGNCAATAYDPETSTWLGYQLGQVDHQQSSKADLGDVITVKLGEKMYEIDSAVWNLLATDPTKQFEVVEGVLTLDFPEASPSREQHNLVKAFDRIYNIFRFCTTHYARLAPSTSSVRGFLSTCSLTKDDTTHSEHRICELYGITRAFAFDLTDLTQLSSEDRTFILRHYLTTNAMTTQEALDSAFTISDIVINDLFRGVLATNLDAVGKFMVQKHPRSESRDSVQREITALKASKEVATQSSAEKKAAAQKKQTTAAEDAKKVYTKIQPLLKECPHFVHSVVNPFTNQTFKTESEINDASLKKTTFPAGPTLDKAAEKALKKTKDEYLKKAKKQASVVDAETVSLKEDVYNAFKKEAVSKITLAKELATIEEDLSAALRKADASIYALEQKVNVIPLYNFEPLRLDSIPLYDLCRIVYLALGEDAFLAALAYRYGVVNSHTANVAAAASAFIEQVISRVDADSAPYNIIDMLNNIPVTHPARYCSIIDRLYEKALTNPKRVVAANALLLPTVITNELKYGNKFFNFEELSADVDASSVVAAEYNNSVFRSVLDSVSTLALTEEYSQFLTVGVSSKTSKALFSYLLSKIPFTTLKTVFTIGQLQAIASHGNYVFEEDENVTLSVEGLRTFTRAAAFIELHEETLKAQAELFAQMMTEALEIPEVVRDLVVLSKCE